MLLASLAIFIGLPVLLWSALHSKTGSPIKMAKLANNIQSPSYSTELVLLKIYDRALFKNTA